MIYLHLFLTFLKIGAVSFGGGYGMIALIRESVLTAGWMTEAELLNFIAVAESTPGPIAVNIATFVGSAQGGVLGAFLATLGVVLPSFIIILLIAALAANLLKTKGVRAVLRGVHPAVAGLVLGTGLTMLLSTLLGVQTVHSSFAVDFRDLLILALLVVGAFVYRAIRKRSVSPIVLILFSAVCGVVLF